LYLNIEELNHNNFLDGYGNINMYNSSNKLINLPNTAITNCTGLFTGITMDVAPNTAKLFKNSDYPIKVEFDPPLTSIDRLSVSWYDVNRNLVNFQGFEDNAVILRVTSQRRQGTLPIIEEEFERPPPPPIPPPKKIREKKTWGRWFVFLVLSAILSVWLLKKREA
jgi:hypothetical protein